MDMKSAEVKIFVGWAISAHSFCQPHPKLKFIAKKGTTKTFTPGYMAI
jgi:hypothetical protein